MTTQGIMVDGLTWKNIVTELSLELNIKYLIQNVSSNFVVLVKKETEPTAEEPRHLINPKDDMVIVLSENDGIWIKSKPKNTVGVKLSVSEFIGDAAIVPIELNGGVPVNVQDQTTRPIIAKFNQVQNSTTLQSSATKNDYTIDVTDTTGFIAGRYIILFEPITENFSFYNQIGAPDGNTITLDTPLDFSYSAGTFVDAAITNLAVDGSVTPQTFGLRGTGAPPGVDITVDITRLIFHCITDDLVDLSKFADITGGIENGLVLRKRDGSYTNIFNLKTNGEIAGIMFDFTVQASTNPVQGQNGFICRLTFAGQNKIGVAIRLPIGEDLELLVQDALQTITLLEIIAEGHLLSN